MAGVDRTATALTELTTTRWYGLAVALGVAAAVAYILSPLTTLCALALPFVVRAAERNLSPIDRKWLRLIVGIAVALRVIAIAALFLLTDHDNQAAAILSGDEEYTLARTLRMRNVLLGVPGLRYDYFIAYDLYGRSSYIWLVTAAQVLFGPSSYGLRVLNVLLFVSGALLLFRCARRAFGRLPSFVGLSVLLFVPTLFLWSIAVLKEPLYFLLAAVVVTATIAAFRNVPWTRRIVSALLVALALLLVRDLREGGALLLATGVSIGVALWWATGSARRCAVAAVVAIAVAAGVLTQDRAQNRIMNALDRAANLHLGHVFTVGHDYKLLDEGFYATLDMDRHLSAGEAARFVVRGIASFIAVPLPWNVETRGELVQLPEHLLWYIVLCMAPFGIAVGVRRDRLTTCLLVGYVLPTAAVVALTNGNVGTLIRFRGLVLPYLIWLAGLGFCVIMQNLIVSARVATARPALRESQEHA